MTATTEPRMFRRRFEQQIRAIGKRRAQEIVYPAFERHKQAIAASLSEHIDADYEPEAFLTELAS